MRMLRKDLEKISRKLNKLIELNRQIVEAIKTPSAAVSVAPPRLRGKM